MAQSGIWSATLSKAETGQRVNDSTLIALANFYRHLGVEFRDDGSVRGPAP